MEILRKVGSWSQKGTLFQIACRSFLCSLLLPDWQRLTESINTEAERSVERAYLIIASAARSPPDIQSGIPAPR